MKYTKSKNRPTFITAAHLILYTADKLFIVLESFTALAQYNIVT